MAKKYTAHIVVLNILKLNNKKAWIITYPGFFNCKMIIIYRIVWIVGIPSDGGLA